MGLMLSAFVGSKLAQKTNHPATTIHTMVSSRSPSRRDQARRSDQSTRRSLSPRPPSRSRSARRRRSPSRTRSPSRRQSPSRRRSPSRRQPPSRSQSPSHRRSPSRSQTPSSSPSLAASPSRPRESRKRPALADEPLTEVQEKGAAAARPKKKPRSASDERRSLQSTIASTQALVAQGSAVRACGEEEHDAGGGQVVMAPAMGASEEGLSGLVRRAAAWRVMYNPKRTTQLIPPEYLGFHKLNRDGIACNGDRCDSLLGQFLHDGFDEQEANRDNFAVKPSGTDDLSITYNIEVCAQQDKLATLALDWRPIGFTLAHSHVNQIFKNINAGAPSDIEGVVDSFGNISIELIKRKDLSLAQTAHTGLDWELFPAKMIEERPMALHDISEAANIKNGVHLVETEMQALQRLGRHSTAETNAAQEVCYESTQRKLATSMPKLASSPHFKELFSLVINLGGYSGPWLLGLAEFYGQFVNADVRKLRFGTLALLGTWPPTVRGEATAPLIVAILKACYACDAARYMREDYLEFITMKDIKLNESDADQVVRLDSALAALKYFNLAWQPALAAVARGLRIQLQGQTDIEIAQAFLMKDTHILILATLLMKH